MGHACEWETSMMLRLDPRLVRDPSRVEPVPFGNPFEPASRGWITRDRSEPGHIGDPREASARRGRSFSDCSTRTSAACSIASSPGTGGVGTDDP